MADIFLSYAREDRERARTIALMLESGGWTVFWDANIKAKAEWRRVLESELDAARAVIVLWSRASIASGWVTEEAERGRAKLISVQVDDVPMPLGFSQLQAVNLVGWRGGRHAEVDRLVAAVSETLKAPPPRPPVPPPPPQRKWYAAAAIALVVAAAATYPVVQWINAPPPIMNQEIVLDASAGMAATFDTSPSKLAAAVDALRVRNLHPKENLALRDFGGECGQDESRVLVSFGTSRRNRILKAAAGLRPHGKPTLASAVISAMADLQPLANTKRVVVLTGHADSCHEEAIRDIKERLAAYKAAGQEIALEMRFIGLAVPANDQTQIQAMSDAVSGHAYFVNTAAELNGVLEYVLEFEPALTYVRAVSDVVEQVGKTMNEVAGHMNQQRYDEAQKTVDAGRLAYARMQPSFDALAGQRPGANFERFYSLASANRALQQQVFDIGSVAIGQGSKSGEPPTKEYHASVEKWNALVGKYNDNIREMDRIVQEIVKEVRKRG